MNFVRRKGGGDEMDEKRRDWKELMLLSLCLMFVTVAVLAGTVNAVQGAAVGGVTRYAPSGPAPGAEFEVKLTINGEPPLAVGIVETIPEGFGFVSTTHPSGQYEVSGQKIAFAVINEKAIMYGVTAPSSGEGTFSGTWIDLLSENEGSIADTIVMVGGGGTGAIEEGLPPAPTPTPYAPAVTKATRSIPMMEAGKEVAMVFEDMDVSMIALKADKNVSNVELKVERAERALDVPAPSGTSYVYLDIKVENAVGAKIEGRVESKVAKSWISANNIDVTTVKLNRYDRAEGWEALHTTKTGEDDDFVYFEAETPEFSLFAVTGEEKEEVEATPTVTPAATPAITPTPPASKVPGFEAIFTAVSLLIFALRKRKKGGDDK
jgi:PGF-pre-PGF domain-containing protein